MSSCQSSTIDVAVQVRNPSTSTLDTLPVAYEYLGNVVRDTIFDTMAPYADTVFVFPNPITWSGTSNGSIRAWTELSGDMNGQNDTIDQTITYLNSSLYACRSFRTSTRLTTVVPIPTVAPLCVTLVEIGPTSATAQKMISTGEPTVVVPPQTVRDLHQASATAVNTCT